MKKTPMDTAARRYQTALAHQAYGVVLVSEDGLVEFVNQQFCDLFELDMDPSSLAGLSSQHVLELVAPTYADPAGTLERIEKILSANVDHLGDEVGMRDGRTILVDYTPVVVDDRPGGRMWTYRDITQPKQVREALRLSEEKFAAAFQTSPHAMSISRLEDGVLLEVNDALVSMSGYSREELIGSSSLELGLWADSAERDRVFSALQDSGRVSGREIQFRNKSGRVITGLFSANVINLSQGPCLLASVEDISARKQAEHDLQRNRRLLSDIMEHGGTLIFVKDRESRYELVNRKWETSTGIRREEAIGHTDVELFPESTAKEFYETDLQVMESESELETEQTLEDQHGKRFYISNKFPVYEEDGSLHGVCGIVTEITALKQVEEQIRHLATHDTLTDLPTLSLAKDRLSVALGFARRQNTQVAVMFVDLDGFKEVNDTFGHEIGDRVLQETAMRMLGGVRETDTVARVGGDEFLIVVTGLHGQEDASRIARKVVKAVSEPIALDDGRTTSVSASVGIALCEQCGQDPDAMIRLADAAMYRVKSSGKNGYRFAEPADG